MNSLIAVSAARSEVSDKINSSRPDPGSFKAFIKPFDAPQRSVKIKI